MHRTSVQYRQPTQPLAWLLILILVSGTAFAQGMVRCQDQMGGVRLERTCQRDFAGNCLQADLPGIAQSPEDSGSGPCHDVPMASHLVAASMDGGSSHRILHHQTVAPVWVMAMLVLPSDDTALSDGRRGDRDMDVGPPTALRHLRTVILLV